MRQFGSSLELFHPEKSKVLIKLFVCASISGVLLQECFAQKAASKEPAPSSPHPWIFTRVEHNAASYITNLQSGDTITTPFVLRFGLSGDWAIAPISKPVTGKFGHHHLLINKDLPLDYKKALPFDDHHIHFGKGQMETVLNLAPGPYTLRMLFADANHVPHFVYSKPVQITVKVQDKSIDPKSLLKTEVLLLSPKDGEVLNPPFRIQFHASGLPIAQLQQQIADSGYFRLTVSPSVGAPVVFNFEQGHTQVNLNPPKGAYKLNLDWVRIGAGQPDIVSSKPVQIRVN